MELNATMILSVAECARKIESIRQMREAMGFLPLTVVATGGVYDLCHYGHVRGFWNLAAFGDYVIVFINGDRRAREIKGDRRPIFTAMERAEVVDSHCAVNDVCVFHEDTPCDAIDLVRPDVWVKGEDWRDKYLPERKVVEAYGGRVEFVEYTISTTELIERIKGV